MKVARAIALPLGTAALIAAATGIIAYRAVNSSELTTLDGLALEVATRAYPTPIGSERILDDALQDGGIDVCRHEHQRRHLSLLARTRPQSAYLTAAAIAPSTCSTREALANSLARSAESTDNATALSNAALMLRGIDETTALGLATRAASLDPRHSRVLLRMTAAKDVQGAIELARELADGAPTARASLTPLDIYTELCLRAGTPERAEASARFLLEHASLDDSWNEPNLRHLAHTVLGVLAYESGDRDTAYRHLLSSLSAGSSPQLASYGPWSELLGKLEGSLTPEQARLIDAAVAALADY